MPDRNTDQREHNELRPIYDERNDELRQYTPKIESTFYSQTKQFDNICLPQPHFRLVSI